MMYRSKKDRRESIIAFLVLSQAILLVYIYILKIQKRDLLNEDFIRIYWQKDDYSLRC